MSTNHFAFSGNGETAPRTITLTEDQFRECLFRSAQKVTSGDGKLWLGGASRPDGSAMLLMIDGDTQFEAFVDDAPPVGINGLWGNEINYERALAILNNPYFSSAARTVQ